MKCYSRAGRVERSAVVCEGAKVFPVGIAVVGGLGEKIADSESGEMQGPTKEVSMRKVVAVEFVSLDGVMESPEEWAFSYTNDEMEEANALGMAASDALLLGRVTYEQFAAYWPNQSGGVPNVDYLNSVSKFVVSRTLEEVE